MALWIPLQVYDRTIVSLRKRVHMLTGRAFIEKHLPILRSSDYICAVSRVAATEYRVVALILGKPMLLEQMQQLAFERIQMKKHAAVCCNKQLVAIRTELEVERMNLLCVQVRNLRLSQERLDRRQNRCVVERELGERSLLVVSCIVHADQVVVRVHTEYHTLLVVCSADVRHWQVGGPDDSLSTYASKIAVSSCTT